MKRSIIAVSSAVLLALLLGACATRQPVEGRKADDLDRKFSTFAYIEQGQLVTFIVDTLAARYRDNSGYMPIEFALANTGLRTLTVSRESFTLIDEQGNRYPAATPRELLEGYQFLELDRERLSELPKIAWAKFSAYRQYDSQFSPVLAVPGGTAAGIKTIVVDVVYLPKHGFIHDFIYFPKPVTGIKGHRFDLFLESPNLENPVFVKFEVK